MHLFTDYCNPLTKEWVSLPLPPTRENYLVVSGFICNDKCFSSSLVSTSFKVVTVPKFYGAAKEFKVEVFSSDSGEWKIYHVSCPHQVTWNSSCYDNLMTHKGVFYWFQKEQRKILAVSVNENTNRGTCAVDCRLINMPEQEMDGDFKTHHRLGESEGLICYAVVNAKEKTLSVWVLGEDWTLLYKDDKFDDTLFGSVDFISHLKILGFNPVDKNVVIFGFGKTIWAYNIRTKGCEQLSHPSFMPAKATRFQLSFLTFALKPRPSVLPPVSW